MKKHICPYINSTGRCTHKTYEMAKKAPMCQYNDPLKCRWYNDWLDKAKSLRSLPRALNDNVRNGVEEYKRRWIK